MVQRPAQPESARARREPTDANRRIWQCYTVDRRWVCPFCLSAARPESMTPQAIRGLIQNHLSRDCSAYQGGQGKRHPLDFVQRHVLLYNVEYNARNDRAWQVFDHEGYWFSPTSLARVPSVRLHNRRFDATTVHKMAEYLATCPYHRQGVCHPVEAVQRARDHAARVASLSRNLLRVMGQKVWSQCDASGAWVCPYCLGHHPSVDLQQPDQPAVSYAIADHLLTSCSVYAGNPQGIHSETEVVRAAKQGAAPIGLGGRLPSNPALQIAPLGTEPTPRMTMTLSPLSQGTRPSSASTAQPSLPVVLPPAFDGFSPPQGSPQPSSRVVRPGQGAAPANPEAVSSVRITRPVKAAPPAEDLPSARIVRPPTDRKGKDASTEARVIRPAAPVAPKTRVLGRPATTSSVKRSVNPPPPAQPPVPPAVEQALEWMAEPPPIAAPLRVQPRNQANDDLNTPATNQEVEDAVGFASDALSWMDDVEEVAAITPTTPQEIRNSEFVRAKDVQLGMLRDCPTLPGFQFATRYEPATEISGDFYEFIQLSDGRIGFALGDVSGHGMGAGLIMTMAKKVLAVLARRGDPPDQVLAQVNDALTEDLGGKQFVTMTYAILDPSARTITWARAGHNPTLVVNRHSLETSEIRPPGMVVGMKSGKIFAQSIRTETTTLRSGDVFLLYTDGITETKNRQEDEYGQERLGHLLVDHLDKDLDHVLERIMDSIRQFRGGLPIEDDMTLLALAVE